MLYLHCENDINDIKQGIMTATTYNKSQIMKQAWTMFRSKFYGYRTFAEALKMAWHYAKEEVARIKQVEARKAEQAAADAARKAAKVESKQDKFYKEFGKQMANRYRNVTMGKNDWRVSFGRRYY
jgi:hypothetical protein